MPVMPAPTTSTSSRRLGRLVDGRLGMLPWSAFEARGVRCRASRTSLYRPVSIRVARRTVRGGKWRRAWRSWTSSGRHCRAVRDRVPRPGAQAALLRPGVLRARDRAAVAPGLADGVPARGDPEPVRLRRVRDPRPVDLVVRRPTTAASGLPERLPPPRGAGSPGRGTCQSGFTCPFHGWCYGPDGKNTAVTQRRTFYEHNLEPAELDLVPVRCETWGGCAWINLDPDAPPLRAVPRAVRHRPRRLEARVDANRVVVRLPAAGELEARPSRRSSSSTTCCSRIPSCESPAAIVRRRPSPSTRRPGSTAEMQYLHTMSDGMSGMVHAKDVHDRRGPAQTSSCPADPEAAMRRRGSAALNDAVVRWHRDRWRRHPRPERASRRRGIGDSMFYGFPHFFVLPMYSSASSYRFRPLGPGGDADGDLVADAVSRRASEPRASARPRPGNHDDPRWPPIPAQDFSNIPRQQKGLHARGFEYMRLSAAAEGGISNFERTIDGFLAGLAVRAAAAGACKR